MDDPRTVPFLLYWVHRGNDARSLLCGVTETALMAAAVDQHGGKMIENPETCSLVDGELVRTEFQRGGTYDELDGDYVLVDRGGREVLRGHLDEPAKRPDPILLPLR